MISTKCGLTVSWTFSYVQSDDPGSLEVTLDENLHQYLNVDIHDRILTLSFDKKVKVGN